MEVIARIDISTPSGLRTLKELQKKKSVNLEYPLPESISGNNTRPFSEVYEDGLDRLSEHYGTDIRKLK